MTKPASVKWQTLLTVKKSHARIFLKLFFAEMIKTKLKFLYVAGLFVVLIISVGAGYFFVEQGENYEAVDTTRRKSSVIEPSTAPLVEPEKFSPPLKQTGELNALDLSLGVLSIDDPEEKVRKALGVPFSSKADEYGTHEKFDSLEVVIRNGKVVALVSQTSAVSTPRGIHDGSPAQKVFDEYGTNYKLSYFENLTLYEYTITSKDGTPCWLRFAVREEENKVDYISIRFVQ